MLRDNRGFFEAMFGDGRPLISLTGICLALAGGFVLFQAASGHFLPQDTAYLQMSSEELCKINQCRIVHFMIHDRVSFGGALVAIGAIYLWLAEFPMQAGAAWAWWTLLASGVVGFGSFLTYLSYGYLDTWHGAATLALLPCFVAGLLMARRTTQSDELDEAEPSSWRAFAHRVLRPDWRSPSGVGRVLLLVASSGLIGAGLTIQFVGMTCVFVPTDLSFMGLDHAQLNQINPRLIPLIAHDRAGFGGAVATIGLLVFAIVVCARPSRSSWQALLVAGLAGWSTAIGVHPVIGYTDPSHLAPAIIGAFLYFLGLLLTFPSSTRLSSIPLSAFQRQP